ncbi:MAG: recombinase family protein [Ruminococcus sp.]|nr:recombinase family protein [Ruminococcus sp.]
MKIAAAYIRVSTEDQIEYSPESQLKAICSYAKTNNMLVPDDLIFIDEGISGRTAAKRPAFMRMIGMAKTKPKEFDVILLWKFSRFARNREDSIMYKSMLRKQCGIDVISISENLGDDKTSVLIEALIEAMDEYYSINLAEEVRRGMTEKVSRGEPVSGAPFGYKMIDKAYIPDKDESVIVQRIFDDFSNGVPTTKIARVLNSEGILTKNGKKWENRTIEYILRNVAYIGKISWNSSGKKRRNYDSTDTILVDGIHEPIISKELFDTVQERILENKKKYGKNAHPTHGKIFALKGLLKCSNCGSTLCLSMNLGVQCHGYTKGKCNKSHYIRLDKITPIVIEQLQADLNNEKLVVSIANNDNRPEYESENTQIKQKLDMENKKLKRAKEAYMAEVDTLEEYKANKATITKRIEELKKMLEITSPQNEEEMLNDFRARLADVLEVVSNAGASEEAKNDALRSLIYEIIFHRISGKVEIVYK